MRRFVEDYHKDKAARERRQDEINQAESDVEGAQRQLGDALENGADRITVAADRQRVRRAQDRLNHLLDANE